MPRASSTLDLFGADPSRETAASAPSESSRSAAATRPLADRLRPAALEEVVGQDAVLGPSGPIGRMVAAGRLASLVLWGPPGVGKTTIARLMAARFDLAFEQLSAIFSGVADLKKAFEAARLRAQNGRGTALFVDEIHRFNRAQQDAFLPVMEEGVIVLIGATTENPSFALNAALLSRAEIISLTRLEPDALAALLARAETEAGRAAPLTEAARAQLLRMADGDGRALLNLAEAALALDTDAPVDVDALPTLLSRRAPIYDKTQDAHYNLISALHKSVRGSDPDAALYWFCRMLEGGEDPLYLARRLVRMASEDIGLAEPEALEAAVAAKAAFEALGSPEGELALAQLVVRLALAPKSNAVYVAYKAARKAARDTGSTPPPKHILNAPTKLMRDEGYGSGYAYDHDAPEAFSGRHYFPNGMTRERYYAPVERGFEREMAKRVAYFDRLRAKRGGGGEREDGDDGSEPGA